jgi:hypothetical protein
MSKPFDDDEWKRMFELCAYEMSGLWMQVDDAATFDRHLRRALKVSVARYRRWVEENAASVLVSTALMQRKITLLVEARGHVSRANDGGR